MADPKIVALLDDAHLTCLEGIHRYGFSELDPMDRGELATKLTDAVLRRLDEIEEAWRNVV